MTTPNRGTPAWSENYAAVCKALYELFDGEPPLLLFEDDMTAYRIDPNGHVHRDHRELQWKLGAAFIGSHEVNHPDAVAKAIRQETEN
jgi:hypothetical protein